MKLLVEKEFHSGVMVALFIPFEVARRIAIPGGERPNTMHVTLAYVPAVFGQQDIFEKMYEAVSEVAEDFMPVEGIIGGVGKFNGSETSDFKEVFYASFDSPGLSLLREEIIAALDYFGAPASTKHGFTPHVTLKYISQDEPLPRMTKSTERFRIPYITIASNNRFKNIPFQGHRITKSDPGRSSVHVNAPLGSEEDKVMKDAPLGDEDYDMMDFQREVCGTDYEMVTNGEDDPTIASQVALAYLAGDPEYYKKLRSDGDNDDQADGYYLDLGSGENRNAGFIGLDMYPHDHGTLVHDLSLGIPFPDGVVKSLNATNCLHEMTDPKPLLAEINRVLMPGGVFTYEGPHLLEDIEGLDMDEYQEVNDGKQPTYKQAFSKPQADAATADDAEPRVDIGPYDSLDTDQLMAMQSLEYDWSDATTSHEGNIENGYPSQGALSKALSPLKIAMQKLFGKKKFIDNSTPPEEDNSMDVAMSAIGEVTKGGPGSGRHPEGGAKQEEEHERTAREVKSAEKAMNRATNRADDNPGDQKAEQNRQDKVKEYVKAQDAHVAALKAKLDSLKGGVEKSEDAGPTDRKNEAVDKILKSKDQLPIFKAEAKKQIVFCVVLEPEEVDSQDDWMTAEDIEETAHAYLAKSRVVGAGHSQPINGVPVESYIAPQDLEFKGGPYGDQKVKKGSWVLGIKVHDQNEWKKVETGEYSGFSVGGLGLRD